MTNLTKSTQSPRLLWTAIWFVIATLFGCIVIAITGKRGGVLALALPLVAFFLGSFLAAGELHLGLRGRFGFGIAGTISMIGSLLTLVSTQAAGGRENFFLVLTIPIILYSAVGAALGLLLIRRRNNRAFTYGLLGFVAGSFVSGTIVAIEMRIGVLNFLSGLPMIPIPIIAGAMFTAWAMTTAGKSNPGQV